MKIIHLISSLKIGGAESALYNFLTRCGAHNQHLVFYFHDGENRKKLSEIGIKTVQVKGLISFYDPLALFHLIRKIKKEKPDLIHSSLWSANIIGRIISKILDIPIICDLHNEAILTKGFRNFLDLKTAHIPKKIVSVSHSVFKSFNEIVKLNIKNENRRNIVLNNHIVIQNGIDSKNLVELAKQNPIDRAEFKIKSSDFVVGAVGRLEPIKSYDFLIKSFYEFIRLAKQTNLYDISEPKLMIIGDGSEKNKLIELTNNLKLNNFVIFTGTRTDLPKIYSMFDCFAISSQTEGLSIALLEAMSFGLPIISTNKNKIHDLIIDQKNGFLINFFDIENYSDALYNLYQNKDTRKKMGLINRKLVLDKFDISKMINAYIKTYNQVITNDFSKKIKKKFNF